jgi:hypothetical protein
MPHFRVRVEGKDISANLGDSVAVGFFATRSVRADSPGQAGEKVRAMLVRDWTVGRYATWNDGSAPTIVVEKIQVSSWIAHLFFKNDGHTFYADDDDGP